MKKSKIFGILAFFILMILFCVNNVYGFINGDKVKCNKKSYHYELTYPSTVHAGEMPARYTRVKGNNNAFEKGTILKYIKDEGKDGICQVEYEGKIYYVKEVNLTADKTKEKSPEEEAAEKIYSKYKNINLSNLSDEELKKALDNCIKAKEQNIGIGLKVGLEAIIENIQREAQDNRGKQIQDDGSFDGPIDTQDWEDVVNKTEKEQEENAGGIITITEDSIYQKPQLIKTEDSTEKSLDDMMGDADDFLATGEIKYNEEALQTFSKTMYNILLAIGVVVAVLIGAFIGLKLMTITSAEEKAEITKLIIPYVIGCIVIFGGFAIWKITVQILNGI